MGIISSANPDNPTSGPRLAGGGTITMDTIQVRDFTVGPAVSSLAIGHSTPSAAAWTRLGQRISLLPTHSLSPRDKAVLYYEIYGIRPDAPLHSTMRIVPRTGNGIEVSVAFDEVAAFATGTGIIPVVRTLDVSELAPGIYDLFVRVESEETDLVGRTVLEVVERN